MDDALENVYHLLDQRVGEASREILAKKKENKSKEEKSVLEKLIDTNGPDSEIPTLMAMDGMVAGIDTTAHSAVFLLYLLAVNQDKQEKLYREILENVGKEGNLTESSLAKMSYLKACFQESLRLLPTAIGTSRINPVREFFMYPTGVGQK